MPMNTARQPVFHEIMDWRGALAVALIWIAVCSAANASQLSVEDGFDQQTDRVLPSEKVVAGHHDISAVIDQSAKVRTELQTEHARRRGSVKVSEEESNRDLGPNEHSHWRVASKDKLIYISEFLTFRRAILVSIGNGSCTAEAAYTLKPGFSDYHYRRRGGDVATARSMTASNLTCSVSQNVQSPEPK
jgi:hypothetical protein